MRSEIRNVAFLMSRVSRLRPDIPGNLDHVGYRARQRGRAGCSGGERMKTDLSVILRRLAEVRAVEGNVQTPPSDPSAGPGISRYQKRSAHLRTRDCSVDLTDFDVVDVDLTED